MEVGNLEWLEMLGENFLEIREPQSKEIQAIHKLSLCPWLIPELCMFGENKTLVVGKNSVNPKFYTQKKYPSKNKDKIKTFSNNQNQRTYQQTWIIRHAEENSSEWREMTHIGNLNLKVAMMSTKKINKMLHIFLHQKLYCYHCIMGFICT